MKHAISLAVLLLAGCSSGGRYLVTLEATTRLGQTIRFTTYEKLHELTEERIDEIRNRYYENPSILPQSITVLAIVKMEDE